MDFAPAPGRLLAEERHPGGPALVAYRPRPREVHVAAPTVLGRLAAHDDPADPVEERRVAVLGLRPRDVRVLAPAAEVDRPEERFAGQEPQRRRDRGELADPKVRALLVLDARPEPDVRPRPSPERVVGPFPRRHNHRYAGRVPDMRDVRETATEARPR